VVVVFARVLVTVGAVFFALGMEMEVGLVGEFGEQAGTEKDGKLELWNVEIQSE